jgi:hypothetical protein
MIFNVAINYKNLFVDESCVARASSSRLATLSDKYLAVVFWEIFNANSPIKEIKD